MLVEAINRLLALSTDQHTAITSDLDEFKTDSPLITVPNGFKLQDLEPHMPQRTRFRGHMQTDSLVNFRDYCEVHDRGQKASACFIQGELLRARAVFDLGDNSTPLHGDHTAGVKLEHTPEYKAIKEINEGRLHQRDMAEWIEEWRDMLTFAADLDFQQSITIGAAVSAIRNMDIKQTRERGHVQGHHSTADSILEKEELKDADRFPTFMRALCQPTQDLQPREIVFRLSVLTGDRPGICPKIMRWGSLKREIGDEFAAMVEGELAKNTDMLVFCGDFDLG